MKKIIFSIITFFYLVNYSYAEEYLLHSTYEPTRLTIQCYDENQQANWWFLINSIWFSNLITSNHFNIWRSYLGNFSSIDMWDYVFLHITRYDEKWDKTRTYSYANYIFDKKSCSYQKLTENLNLNFFILNNNLYFNKSQTELYEIAKIPTDSSLWYEFKISTITHNFWTINYIWAYNNKYLYNNQTQVLLLDNNKSILAHKFSLISNNILINKQTIDLSNINFNSKLLFRDNFFTTIDGDKNINTHYFSSNWINSFTWDINADLDRNLSSVWAYGLSMNKEIFKNQNYYSNLNNLAIVWKYDNWKYYSYYQKLNDNNIYTDTSIYLDNDTSWSWSNNTWTSSWTTNTWWWTSNWWSTSWSWSNNTWWWTSNSWDYSSFWWFFASLWDKISNTLNNLFWWDWKWDFSDLWLPDINNIDSQKIWFEFDDLENSIWNWLNSYSWWITTQLNDKYIWWVHIDNYQQKTCKMFNSDWSFIYTWKYKINFTLILNQTNSELYNSIMFIPQKIVNFITNPINNIISIISVFWSFEEWEKVCFLGSINTIKYQSILPTDNTSVIPQLKEYSIEKWKLNIIDYIVLFIFWFLVFFTFIIILNNK